MTPSRALLETARQLAEIEDALSAPLNKASRSAVDDSAAYVFDPLHSITGGGYIEPSGLDRATLRAIAKTPLISIIIATRLRQIAPYLKPSDNPYVPGFQIQLRDRGSNPSPAASKQAAMLTDWIVQAGRIDDPRQFTTTRPLTTQAAMLMRDSLTFDLATAEILMTRDASTGRDVPGRIRAVDAGTMYYHPAVAATPQGVAVDDYNSPCYVQVIDGRVVADFDVTSMMWGQRNPTTDIAYRGYGIPELEVMAPVFTAYALAWKRNARYFTHGFTGAGFITVVTADGMPLDKKAVSEFKGDVRAQLQGHEGSHRVAVVSGPEVKWVKVGNDVQDQQWSEWMHTQIRDLCGAFGMDAIEIGWAFGNANQGQQLGGTDPINRARESKARGLHPLIHSLSSWMNQWVIWQIDPDFEMVPTGTGTRSEKEQLDLDRERKGFATANEIRRFHNLPERADAEYILTAEGLQAAQLAAGAGEGEVDAAEALDTGSLFEEESSASSAAAVDAGGGAPEVENLRMSRRLTITV